MVRKLKAYYLKDSVLNDNNLKIISTSIRNECGENIPSHMIELYFNDRSYREKRKKVEKTRRIKTEHDKGRLQLLWERNCGKCPSRGVDVDSALRGSSLTYEDVQQWFGQRRYSEGKKCKHKLHHRYIGMDVFSEIGDTKDGLSWINSIGGVDCDTSPDQDDINILRYIHMTDD